MTTPTLFIQPQLSKINHTNSIFGGSKIEFYSCFPSLKSKAWTELVLSEKGNQALHDLVNQFGSEEQARDLENNKDIESESFTLKTQAVCLQFAKTKCVAIIKKVPLPCGDIFKATHIIAPTSAVKRLKTTYGVNVATETSLGELGSLLFSVIEDKSEKGENGDYAKQIIDTYICFQAIEPKSVNELDEMSESTLSKKAVNVAKYHVTRTTVW